MFANQINRKAEQGSPPSDNTLHYCPAEQPGEHASDTGHMQMWPSARVRSPELLSGFVNKSLGFFLLPLTSGIYVSGLICGWFLVCGFFFRWLFFLVVFSLVWFFYFCLFGFFCQFCCFFFFFVTSKSGEKKVVLGREKGLLTKILSTVRRGIFDYSVSCPELLSVMGKCFCPFYLY